MTAATYGSFAVNATDPLVASQTELDPEEQSDGQIVGTTVDSNDNKDCRINGNPSTSQQPPLQFNLNSRFAADRTYLAADRTAIAWVRTAMSMIGFGVTLAKGADFLESDGLVDNASTMYAFGVLFVATAWVGLVMVIVQNIRLERRISATGYGREESAPLGLVMAIFMLAVCTVGIVVVFRDQFGLNH